MHAIDLNLKYSESRVELAPDTKYWLSPTRLKLELCDSDLPFQLAYQTWGKLNKNRDNAILVVHALSGSANLEAWWPELIGPQKPLDPAKDFVICINLLGSCYGSSGPISSNPDSGQQWKINFPKITIRDQVRAQAALIRSLGITQLHAIIGPSLGGMIALEWALREPELAGALVLIATTAQHSAQAIANSSCQRAAIKLDPEYQGGYYHSEQQPKQGLALARQLAFITYRSNLEFTTRFSRDEGKQQAFAIQDYLHHQGHKFTERFDANSYIRLSECMNSHDISRGFSSIESALQTIQQPTLVISLEHDQLYTYAEQAQLAEYIPNAEHELIRTQYGHDGFLIETKAMGDILQRFLHKIS
jgi:homoserine O-acetyltransferase